MPLSIVLLNYAKMQLYNYKKLQLHNSMGEFYKSEG